MTTRRLIFVAAILALVLQMNAQTKTAPQPKARAAHKSSASQPSSPESDGERVFRQNCSRCHNAPEGFSSSISGTIVRHMRVRANLSDKDVKALLNFFNPQ